MKIITITLRGAFRDDISGLFGGMVVDLRERFEDAGHCVSQRLDVRHVSMQDPAIWSSEETATWLSRAKAELEVEKAALK